MLLTLNGVKEHARSARKVGYSSDKICSLSLLEIMNMTGNDVVPIQCDIRDAAAVSTAIDTCVEKVINTFKTLPPPRRHRIFAR